jgi:hypothetical protein
MFVLIQPENMILDTKYKVEDITGFFKLSSYGFLRFRVPHSVDYIYSKDCEFYQFVSNNPQWKMERRSVNIILKRLIGDDCFEW